MPEIAFKGKEYVFNHHLSVPYRPILPDAEKSIGEPDLNGNLIIHGDNLHALKALLPQYAGKVDCIFIDPPYNTGNENWCYNDKVNSPIMQEWLDTNPVDKEDMLRHDKWLALMWPRVRLLHELLSETGSFWMTLDDNEIHRARMMMDEIFGEENFVSAISWKNKVSPANDAKYFSDDYDQILIYAKNKTNWSPNGLERTDDQKAYYTNTDGDPKGDWNSATYTCNKSKSERPNLYYPIINPNSGQEVFPSETAVWRFSKETHSKLEKEGRIYWGENAQAPRLKKYLKEAKLVVPRSVWDYVDVGHTQMAMLELKEILGDSIFQTPKPSKLLDRILQIATDENSTVLDSFAGSGTTAHSVLKANNSDGGSRKFVLVECENYADAETAERVRRVINGYDFKGNQREELLRQKITWSNFQKNEKLLHQIQSIENLEKSRFDKIKKTIKDGELIVTGEKAITEKTEGLGGSFTYCTLGEPLDMQALLSGESLPAYNALASWIFHTSTGQTLDVNQIDADSYYLGETATEKVWMIYQPDLNFLKSPKAALTAEFASQLREQYPDSAHLVLAPSKFIANRQLQEQRVRYAPLPFALYRMESA